MTSEIRNWTIEYDHRDGRSGAVEVKTEIEEAAAFHYGNRKMGVLTVEGQPHIYDLRYSEAEDLHREMLEAFFGDGLTNAIER